MKGVETVIRTILGPARPNIQPLAVGAELMEEYLFEAHIPQDDIRVTKDIYPGSAKWLHKSESAVARSIERLSSRCWDCLLSDSDLAKTYIGKSVQYAGTPGEMLVILAVYAHLELPYCVAVRERPECFLFPSALDTAARFHELRELSFRNPMTVREMVVVRDTVYGETGYCVCPRCQTIMEREYIAFCSHCGQKLDWGCKTFRIRYAGGEAR